MLIKITTMKNIKYFIGFVISFIFLLVGVFLITNFNQVGIRTGVGMIGIVVGGYWLGLVQKTMELNNQKSTGSRSANG